MVEQQKKTDLARYEARLNEPVIKNLHTSFYAELSGLGAPCKKAVPRKPVNPGPVKV